MCTCLSIKLYSKFSNLTIDMNYRRDVNYQNVIHVWTGGDLEDVAQFNMVINLHSSWVKNNERTSANHH